MTEWWVPSSSPTVSTTQSLGWGPCKNSRIYCAGVRAFVGLARLHGKSLLSDRAPLWACLRIENFRSPRRRRLVRRLHAVS
jgi:hypothetical protein